MEIEAHRLADWTDEQVIHFMEGAGAVEYAVHAIVGPNIDVEDDTWDDWKKPGFENVRKAIAESYLYGMDMADLSCKKWHKHCRDKY